jgi:CRP/FNR family transcriptional regulator
MQRLNLIEDTKILAGLSDARKQAIAGIAHDCGFKSGEYLFRIGDKADTLFIVAQGSVELTMPMTILQEEREVMVQEILIGETLAWSALVEPHVMTTSARATSEVVLVGLRRNELLALFESDPECGYRFMANLAAIVGRRLYVTHALWTRELQEKYR